MHMILYLLKAALFFGAGTVLVALFGGLALGTDGGAILLVIFWLVFVAGAIAWPVYQRTRSAENVNETNDRG